MNQFTDEGYPELQPEGCSQSCSASMGRLFPWVTADPTEMAEFWKTDIESLSSRMVWVGKNLKDHAVPTSYHTQGHHAWTFSWTFAVSVSFAFCPLPSQGFVHFKGHILESVWRLTQGHSLAHSVVITPYFKCSGLWKAGN